jgi:hypothetical protein
VEVADYLVRGLLGRIADRHDNHARLARRGQFQGGELAVEQVGVEEVAVPGGQPAPRHIPADLQEGDPRLRPPGEQHLPVALLQGRARDYLRFAGSDALVHGGRDRAQPRHPVRIVQRLTALHLLDVRFRMQQVAVGERPADPPGQQRSDR